MFNYDTPRTLISKILTLIMFNCLFVIHLL